MKRFFLPVLSWTLAMGQLFAQNQLPPSIQPYAVNWGYDVKQMFEVAGIEVPGPGAEVDLVPMIQNRSNELRLDSTVLYYGYVGQASDSTPLFRHVYTYPESNVQVVSEDFFEVDHWITLNRTTLHYDDLGRIVETIADVYYPESGEYIPDSRVEFFPHGDSQDLIDSFFVYSWSTEIQNWRRQVAARNTFDAEDRLFESLTAYEIFEFPIYFLDRYTYNPDGDLLYVESFNVEGEEEIPGEKREFWYDDHLVVLEIKSTSSGEQGFLAESKVEYLYTDFRKPELITTYTYDFAIADWKLSQIIGYEYDDAQRVTILETTNINSGLWTRHRTTSSYVQDDDLAKESGFSYNDDLADWVLEDTKYYYYSELSADDPVEPVADALFMYPNPTSGVVQVKLVGHVSVYVYSLGGQLIRQYRMTPGEKTLDLSALPAGIYQIRAKSDEDYFSGKLLIQ